MLLSNFQAHGPLYFHNRGILDVGNKHEEIRGFSASLKNNNNLLCTAFWEAQLHLRGNQNQTACQTWRERERE